jgi:hypothetical protein
LEATLNERSEDTMMHPPFFHELVMAERKRDLERNLRLAEHRRRRVERPVLPPVQVTLRLCRAGDAGVLRDLATLSGEAAPTGTCVLAEVEGRVVAALPLAGGPVLADPMRPTGHVVPLLQLRARQLNGRPPRRRPPRLRFRLPRWSQA